jgi:hypothetical protein
MYLKYTGQKREYDGLFQKLIRYNRTQDWFHEMRMSPRIWRMIYSSRKTLKIDKSMWSYDIPATWTGEYFKYRLVY